MMHGPINIRWTDTFKIIISAFYKELFVNLKARISKRLNVAGPCGYFVTCHLVLLVDIQVMKLFM